MRIEKIKTFGRQTFSSLKNRNYRLYYIGQGISVVGSWMQTIGQDWLVLKLTNSGTQLGIVSALQFLPVLLFGPLGGLISDRLPKQKAIFWTQLAAGISALVLGTLVITNTAQIWMVYILAIVNGLITAIYSPARQTFIFEIVGKEEIGNAIVLNSTQFNMARVVGPAIAGTLIALVGIAWCFYINAISYIAVLVSLLMMRQSELRLAPLVARAKGQLREGFSYVKSTPILWNILLIMAIIGTLSYEFSVVLPLLARFTFHGDAAQYAALSSAMGAGAVIGGLYATSRRSVNFRSFIKAAVAFGCSLLLAALAPNFILALALLVVVGFFSITLTSIGNTTLQMESAPEMRGRVLSLWSVAIIGSTPIGGPTIGWISQQTSPRLGLAVGGLAAIFAAGIGLSQIKKSTTNKNVSEAVELETETSGQEDLRIP